jgi:hypothetical protein
MERFAHGQNDAQATLTYFTPIVIREAKKQTNGPVLAGGVTNGPNGAANGPFSGEKATNGPKSGPGATNGPSVFASKPVFPENYMKVGGRVIAAEHIPPEDWIMLARNWRNHGQWPNTLGPPPGSGRCACPREFWQEAKP